MRAYNDLIKFISSLDRNYGRSHTHSGPDDSHSSRGNQGGGGEGKDGEGKGEGG